MRCSSACRIVRRRRRLACGVNKSLFDNVRTYRIGQIVPSSNTTMETEIPAILRGRESVEPERFTFHSSDPAVAIVSPTGVLRTVGIGTTVLKVTYQNVDSPPMRLSVSPPPFELRASPEAISATTGDSIALTTTPLDDAGKSVARVVFRISPDTLYWAVTSQPREGDWRVETPRVLHMRGSRAGVVHLTAYSENDRSERRMQTRAVAITVHDR